MIKRLIIVAIPVALLSGCGGSGGDNATSSYFTLPNGTAAPSWASAKLSGGETTDLTASSGSSHAFSVPAANLSAENLDKHLTGDASFEQAFVTAPDAIHPQFDGLGPVNNNNNCDACHQADGRGTPPVFSLGEYKKLGNNESLFLRISIENENTEQCQPSIDNQYCTPVAVPNFSTQLFHRGQYQLRPESPGSGQADVYVRWVSKTITYLSGETAELVRPEFEIRNPYDHPGEKPGDNTPAVSRLLGDDVHAGARVGMPVFGLGLLEAIPEQTILALADENDRDNDEISGRPNYVFDQVKAVAGDPDPVSLGRFGWKANTPSVIVQSLGALRGDMGITNPLFPEESIVNTSLHDQYLSRRPLDNGVGPDGLPEADEEFSDTVTFYAQTLHVPARRNIDDAEVILGAKLFDGAGCSDCHTPEQQTGDHPDGIVALSNQTIYPFTDMLLHDMGDDLADHRQDFLADGHEWKTRPLWGIGFTKIVNPLAGFLHDGRARTLEEAVLWHGGEAETSQQNFVAMRLKDRQALIAFLDSL